jgi:putative transposase
MSARPTKTRKNWNDPGHAHFLTFSCIHRWPLLSKDRSRQWVIDAMCNLRQEQSVELWAYVIMPEHVHLLLYPRKQDYDMARILTRLKQPVSMCARAFLELHRETKWLDRLIVRYPSKTVFRFWQPGGGHYHSIFKERTVQQVIGYIHFNPVRRGLVDRPIDWAWSSARFWEGCGDAVLSMENPFV